MSDLSMNIEGMDELVKSLENLTKKYPEASGELLRKDARKLRKEIAKSAREQTDTKTQSKSSLGRIGSYKLSKVQGYGAHRYIEISAKAPHFHLVEHGHVQLNKKGEAIGFVQGVHFMEQSVKKFEKDMPVHAKNMVDELLKKEGLK